MSARETDTTPTEQTGLAELIDAGLAAGGILPTYDRVLELDEALRAGLATLIPLVQAQADRLNRGTTDWYSRQRAVDDARRVLQDGLGEGLRSAALQVHELARQCGALARYAGS